ncbi:MAG: glycoside hydrolase family 20 zincin-like fold domain-containing protein [Limisphaera sp.]|nr:glycoside hydrolase family 20 zincin-like fold domain-containing protein [Limisphaera sp.]
MRIALHVEGTASERIQYGVERLSASLRLLGCVVETGRASSGSWMIAVRRAQADDLGPEGFRIRVQPQGWLVEAAGDTGLLYGCLALADEIRRHRTGPAGDRVERPDLRLRGVCVGLQKPTLLPGRQVYEYPWTPELFPWFYDRALWTEFLDALVGHRFNSLYLWSGHPFGSIVRVPEYPEAVEVPEPVLRQNMEMLRWLARECDRRAIWLVVKFYNILLPKPFADRHGLPTQLERPHPLAADYTRRAISTFIREYPRVGLLVCLGEALQGAEHQIAWATNVILSGVLEGARAAGLDELPPVIVRTHALEADRVIPPCFAVYTNLYTMTKFNGESLTTDQVRGRLRTLHQRMAALGPHLVNVHLLANLEPFRYFAPEFIRRCVEGARRDLGASGVHLYPLCYWNWPESPDHVHPPLKQWSRDWTWFEAWGRYAWSTARDPEEEKVYWRRRVQDHFGCDAEAADRFVQAGELAGLVAPILLRRFGITEGNRQTWALGMTLEQLVNPERFQPVRDLWECLAPEGARLPEYVQARMAGRIVFGETPPVARAEALTRAREAVALVTGLEDRVTLRRDEFLRWQNDFRCLESLAEFYARKSEAAEEILHYRRDRQLRRLELAGAALEASVRAFEELERRAGPAYRFANSLQTGHRRIPWPCVVRGIVTNYHWSHLLPEYRAEWLAFRERCQRLLNGETNSTPAPDRPWRGANVRVWSGHAETYRVENGARPFTDRGYRLMDVAPELQGLTGIRFSHEEAKNGRYEPVEFEVEETVYVMLGMFRDDREIWLQPPNVDAAAQWAEHGSAEPVLRSAARVEQCPMVDVYARRYGPGRHRLTVPGRGSFVILGVVTGSETLTPRDAGGDWP